MHKYDCKDCCCLVEWNDGGKSSGWGCDSAGKDCSSIDECPEGITELAIGDEVFWNDPDNGECSGYYKVKSFPSDDVIEITNGSYEPEVLYHELMQ